ncbi:DUF5941 domain-containing protein [Streptacidiphilus griseoplanus]|uniref:DUF5941 domain-containing protein n=1 Tax=Peterkaempfera griseoplana TaxID=66896 RepID=UPI000D14FFD9
MAEPDGGARQALPADLAALGYRHVLDAAGPAELARLLAEAPAGERVAVVDRRFVGHRHALRLGLTDPRFPAAAVPGALTADGPEARAALAGAAQRLAASTSAAGGGATLVLPSPSEQGTDPGAATVMLDTSAADEGRTVMVDSAAADRVAVAVLPDTLAAALEAAGTEVYRPELGELVAAVPADDADRGHAARRTAAVDEEAVRLRRAVKSRDGFFTTFCISPYSRYLARWCARRGLTPNQVTTGSLLVALLAAASAATGTRPGFVAAGVLLIASFVLDCTDGQLARYSLQYSTLGAWLDATFDRIKEYAYYAGLAVGASVGGDDVWTLALGAMVLQSCRHVVDFAFMEANHDAAGNSSPTAQLSNRLDRVGWTVWARRIVVLPIGERWALIAVLTALTTPRTTLVVLLIGCAFAACYTTAGRVLRSVTRLRARTDRAADALAELADSGPLAELGARLLRPLARRLPAYATPAIAVAGAALLLAGVLLGGAGTWWAVAAAVGYLVTSSLAVARSLRGPLDWLVPPVFRAAEYLTVLGLAAQLSGPAVPAAFGLVAAVAYHHYDTVYRIRGGTGAPPRWLVRAAGGHEGRVLLLTVAAALAYGGSPHGPAGARLPGAHALQVTLAAMAAVLALVVLAESIRFWVFGGEAPAVHDETGDTA